MFPLLPSVENSFVYNIALRDEAILSSLDMQLPALRLQTVWTGLLPIPCQTQELIARQNIAGIRFAFAMCSIAASLDGSAGCDGQIGCPISIRWTLQYRPPVSKRS
jgi:hypothetical protein